MRSGGSQQHSPAAAPTPRTSPTAAGAPPDPPSSSWPGRTDTWTPGTSSTSRASPYSPSRQTSKHLLLLFHHNLSYTSKVLMLRCECLKVSDTPLNAIKVIMRCLSLSINLELVYCCGRFRVRATWWRWGAMTGTPACCSSAPASASAIGGSRVISSRNNLVFLHSFRGKRPVPC